MIQSSTKVQPQQISQTFLVFLADPNYPVGQIDFLHGSNNKSKFKEKNDFKIKQNKH